MQDTYFTANVGSSLDFSLIDFRDLLEMTTRMRFLNVGRNDDTNCTFDSAKKEYHRFLDGDTF